MTVIKPIKKKLVNPELIESMHRVLAKVHISNDVLQILIKWMKQNYREEVIPLETIPDALLRVGLLGPVNGPFIGKAILGNSNDISVSSEQVILSTLRSKVFHLPYWGMQAVYPGRDLMPEVRTKITEEVIQKLAENARIKWSPWSELPVEDINKCSTTCVQNGQIEDRDSLLAEVGLWATDEISDYIGVRPSRANILVIGKTQLAIKTFNRIKERCNPRSCLLIPQIDHQQKPDDNTDIAVFADPRINLNLTDIELLNPKSMIFMYHMIFPDYCHEFCRINDVLVLPCMFVQGAEELAVHFTPCDPGAKLLEHRWRNAMRVLLFESREFNGDLFATTFSRIATALRTFLQV